MNLNQTKMALWIVCAQRAGIRGGAQLVELCDDWAACVRNHGEPVGFEAYVAWTRLYSRATAYRRLDLFRKTFPELGTHGTPEGLMGPLLERLAAEAEK